MLRGFGSGGLSPTRNRRSQRGPDSGHPCAAVCYPPTCHMDRITPLCRRRLLRLSSYFRFGVISASKQYLAERGILRLDIMQRNFRQKTKFTLNQGITYLVRY